MKTGNNIIASLLLIIALFMAGVFLITQTDITFASTSKAPDFRITPYGGGVRTEVEFVGDYFEPLSNYTIYFDGTYLLSGNTDSGGHFRRQEKIPYRAVHGKKDIVLYIDNERYTKTFNYYEPDITVSPRAGRVGENVSITGSYLPPDEKISIYFDGVPQKSEWTIFNGQLTTSLEIPNGFSPGDKKITVMFKEDPDDLVETIEVQDDFKLISGEISLSSQNGTVGTEVTVTGSGFNREENIWIYFKNTFVTSNWTDPFGNFLASFTVPSSPAGYSKVSAFDGQNTFLTAAYFTVFPRIQNFSPGQGVVGSWISVMGDGFSANANIRVTLDGANWTQSNLETDSFGSFNDSFMILDTAGNETGRRIIATDSRDWIAVSDPYFFVKPDVSVTGSTGGQVGATFNIHGSGFLAGEENISLYFADFRLATANCSQDGSFDYLCVILEKPGGQYMITAEDSHGNRINSAFSLSTFTITQNVAITPDNGHIGMQISIHGTGFRPNANITLFWDDPGVSETISVSNSDGTFTGTFIVPSCPKGSHDVTISDGTYDYDTVWNMERIPPPIPALISPASGDSIGHLGGQTPLFTWAEVEDLSGVFYNMEIATDEKFSNIILTKNNLSTNNYTLNQSEALDKGTYFWRVNAVDGAGNADNFTSPFAVNIGSNLLMILLAISIPTMFAGGAASYYYTFGFTKGQKAKIKEVKEKKKKEKEDALKAEKARQEYLQELRKQILVLARQYSGGLKKDFIKQEIKIDDATLELCLEKMNLFKYKKTDKDVFFKDLQKETEKKLK